MSMAESLKTIVGEVNASDSELDRNVYSTDASRKKGRCEAVAWPSDLEQVHKLVMLARRSNTPLMPRGAGTGNGNSIPEGDIAVDVSKLNKIFSVSGSIADVEAGVVLDNLNKAVFPMAFPVQVEAKKAATIGGMIAANVLGIKAMQYGRMADWLEEVTIIDGNGMCLNLKGDALRHVAGLEGATGIIVRAKLKLAKREDQISTTLMKFNTFTALQEKLDELKADADVINIEFLDEVSSSLIGFGEKNHLIVDYAGGKGALRGGEAMDVWQAREQLPFTLGQRRYIATDDLFVPAGQMPKFLYLLRKENIPCYGPIGMGIVYPVFKEDYNPEKLRSSYSQFGIKLGARFGYGKRKILDEETAKRVLQLKAHYDPKNVLSRGKLI
ncbi:MAG TPA: FAD-binding oxidoreductase [Nanoarchaeota archaeon]|nr:FAD-binding oxidoreductase [Nanoarchaeota archaeon]